MKRALTGASLTLLAASGAALASPILDQSYTTATGGEYSTGHDFQQGLTVGQTGQLTSIQLLLSNISSSSQSIEVRIANGASGTVQSTWLFDQKITIPKKFGDWFSIDLSSQNILVASGEALIIDVYDYSNYSKPPLFSYSGSTTGQYLYDRASPGGTSYALLFSGNYEMEFMTFVDTSVSVSGGNSNIATPLPAALPLFAAGLGALGVLGWRRKRTNAAALAG